MFHELVLNDLDKLVDTWLLMALLEDNLSGDYTLQEKKNEHLSCLKKFQQYSTRP